MDGERSDLVAHHSRDLLMLSRPGALEFVSDRVEDLTGWDPAQLLGSPFIALVHPDDRDAFVAQRADMESGGAASIRCRIRHADGSYHWWDARAQGIPDDDGVHRGLAVSSWRIVDDDIAVVEALRTRERWLELVAENSSDVVVLVDHEGTLKWTSREIVMWDTVSPDRFVGRAPWDFFHPDDIPAAMATLAHLVEHGDLDEPFVVRMGTDEAGWRWVAVDGHVIDEGIVVSFRVVHDEMLANLALAESEQRYRTLAENATDVVYTVSLTGLVTWISPSVAEILGWAPHQVVGRHIADFMHPEDRESNRTKRDDAIASGGDSAQAVIRFLASDGSWRWVGLTGRLLRGKDGAPTGGIESLRDMSAEMAARHALSESERRFRLAMVGSPDGMAVIGLDRSFLSVNPALCRVLDRPEEWFGRRLVDDILLADDIEAEHEARDRLLSGDGDVDAQERRVVTANGDVRWVLHSIGLLRDEDERPLFFVSHFQDITSRKQAEASLEHAATHDPLTGLANRAFLVEEIRRSLAASHRSDRPTAVILLDLDHFKLVNDSLGHATGDGLIREAARRISSTVRDSDVVARHGGDEFVVVMRDLDDPTEAVRVAQRLVDVFRQPVVVERNELYATASVGVSVSRPESDVESLLAEADAAMYVAKDEGRDRCSLFNDELRAAITERLRVEHGLRRALEHDALDVWYQPEVDVRTGALTAVEALVRWHHEDGTVQAADAFIGVAEDSGMIVEIGARVIRRSFAAAARWNRSADGEPLHVRVNLSTRQLTEPDLLRTIDDALERSGADPRYLCFEITETAILRDIPTVHVNLQGIHDRGFHLAVDDFGTGYASLTYLRQLPISVLKLDRSFVSGVASDDADRQLIAGVIGLARNMGIMVTAEGVERPEQAAVLSALGCTRAQGYLYAAALQESTMDALIGSRLPNR